MLSGETLQQLQNELIPAIKKREEAAFIKLYDIYSSALYSYILKMVPEEAKAELILKSTFVYVWKNIETYNNKQSSFFIWLLNMARNEAIQTLIESNLSIVNKTSNQGKEIKSSSLQTLLTNLPLQQKTILVLNYFQGFNVNEIAEILKLPVKPVESKLQEVLQQLQ
ncbi:MAG TPA: sigma-70 family RNA polymerase sigma factor [Segetibacter sp.]|nr:sigma-70 family RNA polymerase sigma factor [Segetibacter sp.]